MQVLASSCSSTANWSKRTLKDGCIRRAMLYGNVDRNWKNIANYFAISFVHAGCNGRFIQRNGWFWVVNFIRPLHCQMQRIQSELCFVYCGSVWKKCKERLENPISSLVEYSSYLIQMTKKIFWKFRTQMRSLEIYDVWNLLFSQSNCLSYWKLSSFLYIPLVHSSCHVPQCSKTNAIICCLIECPF